MISFTRLSVREYPKIDKPVVSVHTVYPGASAQVIESQVTKPLEDSLSGIEGVEMMTSKVARSGARSRSISPERDADAAAADVRDQVARVRERLPEEVDEPVMRRSRPTPIRSSGSASYRAATTRSRHRLHRPLHQARSRCRGRRRRVFGERKYAMRVWVDRDRLAASG